MEINTQFSTALVHAEPIQADDCELGLVDGVKSDDGAARRPIHLDNRVDPLIILKQLLEHQPAKVHRQVLNRYHARRRCLYLRLLDLLRFCRFLLLFLLKMFFRLHFFLSDD